MHPKCGCNRSSLWGPPGAKPVRCSLCRLDDDEYSVRRTCPSCGSNIAPYWSAKTGEKAERCKKCRNPDDVNVVDPKCATCSSGLTPLWGPRGGKPCRCARCRLDDDVDLRNPRCACGSGIGPSYAPLGERAIRCSACRRDGDTNVLKRVCICGSGITPLWAARGVLKAERCAVCRLTEDVDVITRTCPCGSGKIARWGVPSAGRAVLMHCTACADHRVHLRYYGPTRGWSHRCDKCPFWSHVPPEFDKCVECRDAGRRIFRKQTAVYQFIRAHWQEPVAIYNTTIPGASRECEGWRRRPDFAFEFPGYVIILECDENQHDYAECRCEIRRMDEVASAYGLPTFWVRFNPDAPAALYGGTRVKAYHALREAFEKAVEQGRGLVEGSDSQGLTTVQYLGYNGVRHTEVTLQEQIEQILACEKADATDALSAFSVSEAFEASVASSASEVPAASSCSTASKFESLPFGE